MLKKIGTVLLALFITQSLFANDDEIFQTFVEKNQIKIMAYNVQNLFDAQHDEGKNDFEFLPKSDSNKAKCPKGNYYDSCITTSWTQRKVGYKLDTIKIALDKQGDYPDILVLSEVENPRVVQMVADKLGYDDFKMTDSPDARGIDLAVLYKKTHLSLIGFEETVVDGVPYPTRNSSAVHFEIKKAGGGKKEILGVYPAHWPSQGTKASFVRINAGMSMRKLIDKYSKKYARSNYHAIALGDFNTLREESPNPIDVVMLDPSWPNRMYDAEQLAIDDKSDFVPHMPQGTYFYNTNKSWNKFDRIFVSGSLIDKSGVDIDSHSFRIHAHEDVSSRNDVGEKIPYRFNHRAENKKWMGFSDHFAVHVIINL